MHEEFGSQSGDTNLYGYVLQDPVNWIDDDGLQRKAPGPNYPSVGGLEGGGSGGAGGGGSGGIGGKGGGAGPGSSATCRSFTPDQRAVVSLAKDAQARGGLTNSEAQILNQFANEYRVPFRGPEIHPGRPYGQFPHFNVGPINHIPLK